MQQSVSRRPGADNRCNCTNGFEYWYHVARLSPRGRKGASHIMTLAAPNIFEVVRRKSGWFLALGIILILLGMIALVAQFASTVVTMVFLGWLLIFSGGFHVIQGFQTVGWKGIALHLLVGVIDVFAGGWLIWQPLTGSLALT